MTGQKSSSDDHREHLVTARQKAYEDFDKTVFALSSGALGISFAFIDKVVGDAPVVATHLAARAWNCWVVSLTIVLVSYWLSARSLSRAIKRHDKEDKSSGGGVFTVLTEVANALGGISFVVGLIFMGSFVTSNLNNLEAKAMADNKSSEETIEARVLAEGDGLKRDYTPPQKPEQRPTPNGGNLEKKGYTPPPIPPREPIVPEGDSKNESLNRRSELDS